MQELGGDSRATAPSTVSSPMPSMAPSRAPASAPTTASDGAATTARTATPPGAATPTLPTQRPARPLTARPLWLAAAAATVFGLVFGAGALISSPASAATPSGAAIEATTIKTISAVSPSVVQIQGRGSALGGSAGSVGSGEILTTSGYIVTNDHVVRGSPRLTALLADGRQLPATLIGEAPTEDLAVIKINANNLKPIAVGNSNLVQVGEYALAIGSPLGLEQSATSGIVSALNRQVHETVGGQLISISGLIQTSAPINSGNSGGALVNLRGQLIGIPTLGAVEPSTGVAANGIGFAISSNRMKTIVRQLTNGAVR